MVTGTRGKRNRAPRDRKEKDRSSTFPRYGFPPSFPTTRDPAEVSSRPES